MAEHPGTDEVDKNLPLAKRDGVSGAFEAPEQGRASVGCRPETLRKY